MNSLHMVCFPGQILSTAFAVGLNTTTGQFRIFGERTIEAIVSRSRNAGRCWCSTGSGSDRVDDWMVCRDKHPVATAPGTAPFRDLLIMDVSSYFAP
jgi:hypothetical protein